RRFNDYDSAWAPLLGCTVTRHHPDRESFISAFRGRSRGRVPVYRRLLGDRLTPVSAYHLLTRGDTTDHAFLLESVVGGEHVGRYSFLGVDPVTVYSASRGTVSLTHGGRTANARSADPLADLRDLLGDIPYHRDPALPGFTGGLVGYAAYDLVRYYEPGKLGGLDGGPPDDRGLPDALFGLYDASVVFDHVDKTIRVVSHATWLTGESPHEAYDNARRRVDELVERLSQPVTLADGEIDTSGVPERAFEANLSRSE